MVRKYQNTIQNTYRVASAADASGSLQTALSKLTRREAFAPTPGNSRARVTSDRGLTFKPPLSDRSPSRQLVHFVQNTQPYATLVRRLRHRHWGAELGFLLGSLLRAELDWPPNPSEAKYRLTHLQSPIDRRAYDPVSRPMWRIVRFSRGTTNRVISVGS